MGHSTHTLISQMYFYTNIMFVSLIKLRKGVQNMQAGNQRRIVIFWSHNIWVFISSYACVSPWNHFFWFLYRIWHSLFLKYLKYCTLPAGQNTHDALSQSIELIRHKLALALLWSIFQQQGARETDPFLKTQSRNKIHNNWFFILGMPPYCCSTVCYQ